MVNNFSLDSQKHVVHKIKEGKETNYKQYIKTTLKTEKL